MLVGSLRDGALTAQLPVVFLDIFLDKVISSDEAFFDIGNLHCYFSDKISGKVVDPIQQCVR